MDRTVASRYNNELKVWVEDRVVERLCRQTRRDHVRSNGYANAVDGAGGGAAVLTGYRSCAEAESVWSVFQTDLSRFLDVEEHPPSPLK